MPICRVWQLGTRGRLALVKGEWDAALEDAESVLAGPGAPLARTWPHLLRGLVTLRRGGDADADLDEAWRLALVLRRIDPADPGAGRAGRTRLAPRRHRRSPRRRRRAARRRQGRAGVVPGRSGRLAAAARPGARPRCAWTVWPSPTGSSSPAGTGRRQTGGRRCRAPTSRRWPWSDRPTRRRPDRARRARPAGCRARGREGPPRSPRARAVVGPGPPPHLDARQSGRPHEPRARRPPVARRRPHERRDRGAACSSHARPWTTTSRRSSPSSMSPTGATPCVTGAPTGSSPEMYRFDADEHSQTLAIALVRERITDEVWRPAREAVGVVCGAGDEQARGRAEEIDRCADRFAQIAATTPADRPAALGDSLTAGAAIMVDLYELAGRLRRRPARRRGDRGRDPRCAMRSTSRSRATRPGRRPSTCRCWSGSTAATSTSRPATWPAPIPAWRRCASR